MGGFFGVVSKDDCVKDLYFGTDYHSHLGTKRGGLAVLGDEGFVRIIHDISNTQFRSKFDGDLPKFKGRKGIGVISDFEDQPLIINSHLGLYAIVTVGVIKNLESLAKMSFIKRTTHFSEMSGGGINPTELVATLINQEASFVDGIYRVQESIEGSCSILLLTENGIYAARDRVGRTPIVIGEKPGSYAAAFETCSFPNLDYEAAKYLGPGEIVHITEDGVRTVQQPGDHMQVCAFLWVYYGYPPSSYENINVENVRYRCGAALARNDSAEIDLVAGIPDSGVAHAIGYANESKKPYGRAFVKYTPTWPRSFMPQDQSIRDLVARMKLIPVREMIEGKRILFCDDSIVRGTQLKDTIKRLFDYGAREVHMRPACPPLVYSCKYLNFSRSRSAIDLAGRISIRELEGNDEAYLSEYSSGCGERYCAMVEKIRLRLGLTTLQYQRLEDLITAIGLPREKICTYCWDGTDF
ncbi:MAG: amidophosphoribosyltransferase [Spirochaetes bacterium]|nr:amidophosphoribosyltransferase [Spirochaetota bacterium]